MAVCTFDEANHVYVTAGGRRLPGISSTLRIATLAEEMRADQEAMDRGSRVHMGIEFDVQGDLNEESMNGDELPYIWAARRARAELDLVNDGTEVPVCNEALGYGTKIDMITKWKGIIAVVNWKTGGQYPQYPIQMALEALCMDHLEKLSTSVARLGIHLYDTGKYKLIEYKDFSDFAVARACATIAAFKRRK